MRIVLIGGKGQLGSDLLKVLPKEDVVPLAHADIEVREPQSIAAALDAHRPDVVINTAAWHRVDDIEKDAEPAFAVNGLGARNLALACRARDCVLVHLSTDYVFDGLKRTPYEVHDTPNPISAYGISKLAGEHFIRYLWPKHYVVRSSGLYGVAGASGKGGNFVQAMLRLARERKPIRVVHDQTTTPTYTLDLAQALAALIQTERFGLYHITNQGQCTWYEFAAKIFELTGTKADLSPTTAAAYGAPARRPVYSVLAHTTLRAAGLDELPLWTDALTAYLVERKEI